MLKLSDLDILSIGNTIQISGVIYEGEGKTFLCFFPGEHDQDSIHEILDMNHADWQIFIRQSDVMETAVLTKAADGTVTKAILRKSQRQIDANTSWKVFKRDGYKCRYCGRDDAPLTVDHLVRWEEGGPTIESNLISSCKKCNRTRGDLPYSQWLKHPRYKNLSRNLSQAVQLANEQLVSTLDNIPRTAHIRSR